MLFLEYKTYSVAKHHNIAMELLDIYYGLGTLWGEKMHDTKKALDSKVLRKLHLE